MERKKEETLFIARRELFEMLLSVPFVFYLLLIVYNANKKTYRKREDSTYWHFLLSESRISWLFPKHHAFHSLFGLAFLLLYV